MEQIAEAIDMTLWPDYEENKERILAIVDGLTAAHPLYKDAAIC